MPKQYTSPFASSFKSAVKRGTPCSAAITSIAKSSNKAPKAVFESLFKAGLCNRQKFNGQWIYWSTQWNKKSPTSNRNFSQSNMWQSFVDWFICSGHCTPEQLKKHAGSQMEFMNFCRKFFAAQFSNNISSSNSSKTSKMSPRKSNKNSKMSSSTRARKTSTSSKKRATSTKAKTRTTTRAKKTTSSPKARKYSSTTRKSSSTRSFKFPTSTRRTVRRAA